MQKKIFVAGHKGMVGSAIVRKLSDLTDYRILTIDKSQLDLTDCLAVNDYFRRVNPDIVILAAAKVGGIMANVKFPTEFLLQNLQIQNNVIKASLDQNIEKFVFIGSSCIYPRNSPQPIKEEILLSGPLEETNEGYALSKIVGLRLVQYMHKQYRFPGICLMPCNLYGLNDSFDLQHSHVLSALVRKIVDAQYTGEDKVEVWGSGLPKREFMDVDDFAESVIHMMTKVTSPDLINIGWGKDISIREMAFLIKKLVGYTGEIIFNTDYPDGMLRKCLDVTKMRDLGFEPKIDLQAGLLKMIDYYKKREKLI